MPAKVTRERYREEAHRDLPCPMRSHRVRQPPDEWKRPHKASWKSLRDFALVDQHKQPRARSKFRDFPNTRRSAILAAEPLGHATRERLSGLENSAPSSQCARCPPEPIILFASFLSLPRERLSFLLYPKGGGLLGEGVMLRRRRGSSLSRPSACLRGSMCVRACWSSNFEARVV